MKNKIILYIAMSQDGFIARKNGSVDFLDKYNKSGDDYGYKEFYDSIGTIIMGNTTYKQFGHTKEFKSYYKDKPIYVFSKTNHKNKDNITFVNCDALEFIKNLKPKNNKNIWLLGGASIIDEFSKHDLIDEHIITVIPITLGEGIPLFKKDEHHKKLKLTDIKKYNIGVIQLRHKK